MLNSGSAIDATLIERATGFPDGHLRQLFASVDAVYADIVADLIEGHRLQCAAAGGVRRRSTTQMITTTFAAFLDHADGRVEQHRAVQLLRLTRPDLAVTGADGGQVNLIDLPRLETQQWLQTVCRIQSVTWNQPVPLLTGLVVATMDGLVTELLHNRDVADVQAIADVFAYHLAAQSTRFTPSTALTGSKGM